MTAPYPNQAASPPPTAEQLSYRDRIRDAVREVEPTAQIILYGSRARGDATPDSDWDLLILLDGSVDEARADAVRDHLFELGLETDSLLIAIVHSRSDWEDPRHRHMPFRAAVARDGISL